MLGVLLLVVGLVMVAYFVRLGPNRARTRWSVLIVGVCLAAAGGALCEHEFGSDLNDRFTRWGAIACLMLAICFVGWLWIGKRARRRQGTAPWSRFRCVLAAVALGAMLLSAWCIDSIPRVRRWGAWAAVPSTLLIAGMEVLPANAAQHMILPVRAHVDDPLSPARPLSPWQAAWLKDRLRARIGTEPSIEHIHAAHEFADWFDDTTAAETMCDMAFRGLVSQDPALQTCAAKIVDRVVLGFKERWGHLGGEYLKKHGQALLPRLIVALDSDDPQVQLAAIRSLGRMGPPAHEAVPRLTVLATGPIEFDRRAYWAWDAIESIGQSVGPLREAIVVSLQSGDRAERIESLNRIDWFKEQREDGSRVLAAVLVRVEEGDDEESLAAAHAAVRLTGSSDPRAIRTVNMILQQASRRTNAEALLAILTSGYLWGLEVRELQPLLSHSHAPLRLAAVEIMWQNTRQYSTDRELAERALAEVAANDPDPAVRAAAASSPLPPVIDSFQLDAR